MSGISLKAMSDEYPDTALFFGYPPEQAEAYFHEQLGFIDCLCHLGMIWKSQWETQPDTIPLEAEINGI